MTVTSRQDAGGRGGLGCVVNFLDCFHMRKRATAGDADGGCELRVAMGRLFGCRRNSKEGSGRCAPSRGWKEYHRWAEGSTGCDGIDDKRRLHCDALACNLRSLAASSVREKGGNGGGGPGPFIGVGRGRITWGVKRNEEGEVTAARAWFQLEEEDDWRGLTSGAHTSARQGRNKDTASVLLTGLRLASVLGRNSFASALFHFYFILFSSFSFSVFLFASYILHKCFKSNQTNCKSFLKLKLAF
jgi:hypothetical protein